MENEDVIRALIHILELVKNHEHRIRSESIHRIALEEAVLPLLDAEKQSQYRAKIGTGFLATEQGSVELSQQLDEEMKRLRDLLKDWN